MRLLCFFLALLASVSGASPVMAQQQRSIWQRGPDASGTNTFLGFVEQPSAGMVTSGAPFIMSGWMVDTAAQGWAGFDQVQIYSGSMGAGGTLLASAEVGLDRPDVASTLGNVYWSQSGFSAEIPAGAVQPGADPLQIYGHTPAKGWWYTTFDVFVSTAPNASIAVGPPNVSIAIPGPEANISVSLKSFTIKGSAYDPGVSSHSLGSGIDRVEVYLNGTRDDPRSVYLGSADISGTNWSLTFSPNLYPWGSTSLYVYAHARFSGEESETLEFISIS